MLDSKRIEKVREVREFLNEIRERIDDFTFDQIHIIERGLLSELPLELIRFCARPEFDVFLMNGVFVSYENGFTLEQLQKYITPQLDKGQISEIAAWAEYNLDFDQFIQELGKELLPKTSYYLMRKVRLNFMSGLSWERIREFIQICKEKNCLDNYEKIEAINEGILAGLSKEEIDTHIRPEHDAEQVKQIIEELIRKKEGEVYKNEKVASFLKLLEQSGKFSERELREIRLGFANGLTISQVRLYAKKKLNFYYMMVFRLYLQSGYSKKQVEALTRCFPSLYDDFACLWLRDGLPLWLLVYFSNLSTDFSWLKWWWRKFKGFSEDQIVVYFKSIHLIMVLLKEGADFDARLAVEILSRLPDDQIEDYLQEIKTLKKKCKIFGFDYRQTLEIILGHLNGLSKEQIKLYAKREFSNSQMEQIRLAYLDGLTQEEIEFLANPEFTHEQMRVIRLSFKFGLSLEQVKKFAKPEYDSSYMEEFLLGYLWGLPEKAIEFYMNTKLKTGVKDTVFLLNRSISYRPQTILRIALLKGLPIPEIEYGIHKFLENESLKATLERLLTDRETRAKIKAFKKLSTELTELKENWKKRISETKSRKRKGFTL